MADPVTLGISAALAVAGGAVGAMGASKSASANASAYQYKAGVAQINQQINKQNAAWAYGAGEAQAMESGLKARQEIGETKVVQAASGFDVNSGTAAAVRESQHDVESFNENVIRWDAAKTSFGYESKAVGDKAEAQLDMMAKDSSLEAGQIGIASSWINAGSNVASKWMQGRTIGMFNDKPNFNFMFGGGSPSGYGAG